MFSIDTSLHQTIINSSLFLVSVWYLVFFYLCWFQSVCIIVRTSVVQGEVQVLKSGIAELSSLKKLDNLQDPIKPPKRRQVGEGILINN